MLFPNLRLFLHAAQCIKITFSGKNCKIRRSLRLQILTVKYTLVIPAMKFSFPHSAVVRACCATLEAVVSLLHTHKTFLTLDQKPLVPNLTMTFQLYVKVKHFRVIWVLRKSTWIPHYNHWRELHVSGVTKKETLPIWFRCILLFTDLGNVKCFHRNTAQLH